MLDDAGPMNINSGSIISITVHRKIQLLVNSNKKQIDKLNQIKISFQDKDMKEYIVVPTQHYIN